MHPFGGTQLCPRCSKAVYAAEQIMGPGRKLYHKPCLSCMTCKKRLDSYTLVEHDQEPYCKSCYTKNFSTRDLRQANLPVREASVSPTPTSPPRKANDASFAQSFPPRVGSPVLQSSTNPTSPPPRLNPTHSTLGSPTSPAPPELVHSSLDAVPELYTDTVRNKPGASPELEKSTDILPPSTSGSPLPVLRKRPVPPSPGSSFHQLSNSIGSLTSTSTSTNESKRLPNPSFSTYGKSSNTTSAALAVLEKEGINPLVQTTTGTRYGAALGGTMNMTGGSPRKWGAATPLCPRCSQRVYFAEQVKAVGQTWHKNCLRCRECNTPLDSSRLRDHDGVPFCVRCYSKLHGPQGSGYALLGKAGS